MEIITTPAELMARCMWTKLCDMVGLSEWAVSEGLMDSDEEMRLSAEVAASIGLIKDTQ